MTNEQIETWIASLDGVTPGPWQVEQSTIGGFTYGKAWITPVDPDYMLPITGSGGAMSWTREIVEGQIHDNNDVNAAHIARCDPDTIRAVLTELLELRAENEMLKEALGNIDSVAVDHGHYESAVRTMKEHANAALKYRTL